MVLAIAVNVDVAIGGQHGGSEFAGFTAAELGEGQGLLVDAPLWWRVEWIGDFAQRDAGLAETEGGVIGRGFDLLQE